MVSYRAQVAPQTGHPFSPLKNARVTHSMTSSDTYLEKDAPPIITTTGASLLKYTNSKATSYTGVDSVKLTESINKYNSGVSENHAHAKESSRQSSESLNALEPSNEDALKNFLAPMTTPLPYRPAPPVTNGAEAFDTFESFEKLPVELRIKIWKLLPEPRTVEVRFSRDGRKLKHRFIADMPTVLHVCHESRLEALKQYKITFSSNRHSRYALNSVYFNNSRDTLYISGYGNEKQLAAFVKVALDDMRSLRRLAVMDFRFNQGTTEPCPFRHPDSTACMPYKVCLREIGDVATTYPDMKHLEASILERRFFQYLVGEFKAIVEKKAKEGCIWNKPLFVRMGLCENGLAVLGRWYGCIC